VYVFKDVSDFCCVTDLMCLPEKKKIYMYI